MTRWVVDGRATGRTTALLSWLLGGEPVRGYPGWSRMLVVLDASMARYTSGLDADAAERFYRAAGFNINNVIITPADLRRMHGIDRSVEVAVDDVEVLLREALGGWIVAVATLTGAAASVDEVYAEGRAAEARREQMRPRPW